MKPLDILMHWGAQLILERPAKKMTVDDLLSQLGQSNRHLTEHLNACSDTQANRRQLCHLIGIERWGQRRLRVAFGEPFLTEEYDHYRPSPDRSWEDLKKEWEITRQASLTMFKGFSEERNIKIEHNQYGSLSVKAWLRYLDIHASSEGKRIRC